MIWWSYQMETFSALLAFCAGNSPVTNEFSSQRPVRQSFDVFFVLRLNKQFSKQSRHQQFEMPWHSLWHHCNEFDRYHAIITVNSSLSISGMPYALTHWGREMHISFSKLTITGSDKGLSPGRCQTIIWTNAGLLLIGPIGTNFSEILIEILIFSLKKMSLKVSSAKWRPFCLAFNVLRPAGTQPPWTTTSLLTTSPSQLRHVVIIRTASGTRYRSIYMMTWSNGNIFHVTGPLCREFTGHRWIPLTKASDVELLMFSFIWALNKGLSKQLRGRWFEKLSRPLWRHWLISEKAYELILEIFQVWSIFYW